MGEVILYRAGATKAPTKRGIEAKSYINADNHKPSHIKYGRHDNIFATYRIIDAAWWVKGIGQTGVSDVRIRELTVDDRDLYIFHVTAWNRASGADDYNIKDKEILQKIYSKYWGTGVSLKEFMSNPNKFQNQVKGDGSEGWEVLLPVSAVKKEKILDKRNIELEVNNHSKYLFKDIEKYL